MKVSSYRNSHKIVIIAIILVIIVVFVCFYVTHNFLSYRKIVKNCLNGSTVEVSLVLAVCKVESNFDSLAVSEKGAKGVMQLTDATFGFVSDMYSLSYEKEDIFDKIKNVNAGCRYIEYLFDKFHDEYTVVCAYNAGEGNVKKWLTDPRYSSDGVTLYFVPFEETADYVKKVLFFKRFYDRL